MKRQRGFSLLELVAVLAIFAIVALIGVQAIQSHVRANDRLAKISDHTQEITLGLALLRHDIKAASPRLFEPQTGPTRPALVTVAGGFDLSIGGLAPLDPSETGFGRVAWRFDPVAKTLTRQVWNTLSPGPNRIEGLVVLNDVAGFEVESFAAQTGWQSGYAPDPSRPDDLPLGLRVTLQHQTLESVSILVSLR